MLRFLSMFAAALLLTLMGCGGDDGPAVPDSGARPDASRDSGSGDGGTDVDAGGMECAGVMCEAFEFCDRGMCRAYRGCVAQSVCDDSEICLHRFCIPRDADPDMDGVTADTDCDETNPEINPAQPEICNGFDDNCDDGIDDADPAEMCSLRMLGGICIDGSCSCPPNTFDLDQDVPGCECNAEPPIDQGLECGSAIDLGDIADSGTMMMVSGNVLPDDRDVWYRFRGVDIADTACDNYHVRVQFTTNPMDIYELTVFRGACGTAACEDQGYIDFNWATDFRQTIMGTLTGQCPCYAIPNRMTNVSVCENDTANYYVRVRRTPGSALTCDSYAIEISNGVYDTP